MNRMQKVCAEADRNVMESKNAQLDENKDGISRESTLLQALSLINESVR